MYQATLRGSTAPPLSCLLQRFRSTGRQSTGSLRQSSYHWPGFASLWGRDLPKTSIGRQKQPLLGQGKHPMGMSAQKHDALDIACRFCRIQGPGTCGSTPKWRRRRPIVKRRRWLCHLAVDLHRLLLVPLHTDIPAITTSSAETLYFVGNN